ncbi:MAG: carbohydrate binding domain-containing protein, partial [Armatimonadota bacterium]
HLHGNRYDSFSISPAAPYVRLRQRTKQLLYRARFMDTVGVETSDPAVRAKVSMLQDAGNEARIINLANAENKTGVTVTLDLKASAKPAGYRFDLEGQEGAVALTTTASGVSFIAPASRASTVIVATRCEPLVRVPVVTLAAGDKGAVAVQLTNVRPQATTAQIHLDQFPPWGQASPVKMVLPAQATTTVRLPLVIPATAERRCYDTHVIVNTPGQAVRRPVQVLVVSPFALSASLAGQNVRVVVRNQSQSAQIGEVTVSGALWDQPISRALQIAPGAETPILLALAQPVTESVTVQARIKSGGQTETRDVTLRPLVLNGGFEVKADGERPAAWSCQSPESVSTTTENPASGQACLKLSGRPGAFVEADQLIPAVVGETYEARCALRRTLGEGARVQPAIVLFAKTGPEQYAYLEKVTDKADDQWNEYAAKFTVGAEVERVAFYLYNVNSTATVWFDDVRVASVGAK